MNLFCFGVAVLASRCRHVSSHLFVFFFFLRCLVEIMDNRNVEMLVNAGQELHSAKIILRETVSTNLVFSNEKACHRINAVNYPFGIQFILLLSILRTLRHKWLSIVYFGLLLFVRLLVFFCC